MGLSLAAGCEERTYAARNTAFLRKIRPKSDYLKSIAYFCDMKSTKEYTQLLRSYRDKNAAKYNITRMGIFGSVARGEQTEDSDVDVYVETSTPNLFALVHIKEELQDGERYQTVYSKVNGSAAAPTAGLHFTKELLAEIAAKGVKLAYVTLHVGLGTFRPVKAKEITEHHMHSEFCMISRETAELLNETKRNHGRIVCVGTTSCRTLESLAEKDGTFSEKSAWTDIFIYPGYHFKAMDALITNFHLPESTLIMLVSAFAGYDHVMNAYQEAVQNRYRFFSFGDAMLIE